MNHSVFELDHRLSQAADEVGVLALSRVLLMNDSRYPWLVLVPQRSDIVEWSDLELDERHQLLDEAVFAGEVLNRLWDIDKVNTATLGNIVPQLHVHVIGRRKTDPAWPGPVWGQGQAVPYAEEVRQSLIGLLQSELNCP